LKEEALDRTMWRNRFGRGFGPVVSQITDDDDDFVCNFKFWLTPSNNVETAFGLLPNVGRGVAKLDARFYAHGHELYSLQDNETKNE